MSEPVNKRKLEDLEPLDYDELKFLNSILTHYTPRDAISYYKSTDLLRSFDGEVRFFVDMCDILCEKGYLIFSGNYEVIYEYNNYDYDVHGKFVPGKGFVRCPIYLLEDGVWMAMQKHNNVANDCKPPRGVYPN